MYIERSQEHGFSLLEMLFALAILSIASLALFQSSSALLQLSNRAVSAGERTLSSALDRQLLNNITDGILPTWANIEVGEFKGSAHIFRGQTTGAPQNGMTRPVLFSLQLEPNKNGNMQLVYQRTVDPDANVKVTKPWVLMKSLPKKSHWLYMGVDHKFYEKWPPKALPSRGFFNDDLLLTIPELPEAIKLVDEEGVMLWTGVIQRAKNLPARLDLGGVEP